MIFKVLAFIFVIITQQAQNPLIIPSIGEASILIDLSYKQLFEEVKKKNSNANLFLIKYERNDTELTGKMIFVVGNQEGNKYVGIEFSLLERSKNNLIKSYIYSANLSKISEYLEIVSNDFNIDGNSFNYSKKFLNYSNFSKKVCGDLNSNSDVSNNKTISSINKRNVNNSTNNNIIGFQNQNQNNRVIRNVRAFDSNNSNLTNNSNIRSVIMLESLI